MATVIIGGVTCDDRWSQKDFAGRFLRDQRGMRDIAIYAANFSQEEPDTVVFPDDAVNIRFVNCNLDNCKLPRGSSVVGGTARRFFVQNDLRDWEIDQQGQPVRVLNEKSWALQGYSVDPRDIPAVFMRREVHAAKDYERLKQRPEFFDAFIGRPIETPETRTVSVTVVPARALAIMEGNVVNPFDESPRVTGLDPLVLTGPITYITVRGPGKVRTIDGRGCENTIEEQVRKVVR